MYLYPQAHLKVVRYTKRSNKILIKMIKTKGKSYKRTVSLKVPRVVHQYYYTMKELSKESSTVQYLYLLQ